MLASLYTRNAKFFQYYISKKYKPAFYLYKLQKQVFFSYQKPSQSKQHFIYCSYNYARCNTKWIQNQIQRNSIQKKRYFRRRDYLLQNSFISMISSQFISYLNSIIQEQSNINSSKIKNRIVIHANSRYVQILLYEFKSFWFLIATVNRLKYRNYNQQKIIKYLIYRMNFTFHINWGIDKTAKLDLTFFNFMFIHIFQNIFPFYFFSLKCIYLQNPTYFTQLNIKKTIKLKSKIT